MVDWMFAIPPGDLDEQEQTLLRQLAEDPEADAISAEEAEQFVAAGYSIRFLSPGSAISLYRAFGIRLSTYRPHTHRRACLTMLRRWTNPTLRDLLCFLTVNSMMGPSPNSDRGEAWTEDLFDRALDARTHLIWLVRHRRHAGMPVDEWLEELGPGWQQYYRVWVGVGKMTLRQLVYTKQSGSTPDRAAPPAGESAVSESLARQLRQKNKRSGALRSDVRQLERSRRELKEQARRRELEVRQMLSQARGEVAAARSQLQDLLTARERELAMAAERQMARLEAIRAQKAGVRSVFLREAGALAARPALPVLAGQAVTIPGGGELHSLLVQALGGAFVPAAGSAVITVSDPGTDLPSLVRTLRNAAPQRIVISCDGLYRRRPGRPGIAVSGFLVRWGRSTIHTHGSLVSCGGVAGSLQAEYGALAMALHWLCSGDLTGVSEVEVQSDCKALLQRVGERRAFRRRRGTVQLHQRVEQFLRRLRGQGIRLRLKWVPREQVEKADRLCDRVYREQSWYRRAARGECRRPLEPFLGRLRLSRRHLTVRQPLQQSLAQVAAARH